MAVTLWVLSSLVLLLNGRDSTVSGRQWVTSGDYQYLIKDQRMTWNEGITFCREQKASAFLFRPTNENTGFLRQFCSGRFVADHHYSGNIWRWSDATPIPSDSKWAMHYPMNDKYWTTGLFDCSTGELLNVDMTYRFFIICQAPTASPTTLPPETSSTMQTTSTEFTTTTESTTVTETTTIKPATTTKPINPTESTTTEPTTTTKHITTPESTTTTEFTTATETTAVPTTTTEHITTTELTSSTEPATTTQPITTKPATTEPTTTEPTTTEPTTTEPATTERTTTETTTTKQPTTTPFQPTTSPSSPCPTAPGWLDLKSPSGRCYYLSTADPDATPSSWKDAFLACQTTQPAQGASLMAVPDTLDFYAVVFRLRHEASDVWTGLLQVGGKRSWVDKTPYDKHLDQFLAADSSGGTYGFLSATDGMFNFSSGGAERRAYVCSLDSSPPPTTSPAPASSTSVSPRPSPTTPPPACEDPWLEYSGRCYLFADAGEPQPWATAGHECSVRGGDLVSIHRPDVLTFLLVRAGQTPFWIGLQNEKDVFVWADGSATDDIDTIRDYLDEWEEEKNCVTLNSAAFPKTLEHQDCFDVMPYICSKKANDGSQEISQY